MAIWFLRKLPEEEGEDWMKNIPRKRSGVMKMFYIFISFLVTQQFIFPKLIALYWKLVNCIICVLYLDKIDYKTWKEINILKLKIFQL